MLIDNIKILTFFILIESKIKMSKEKCVKLPKSNIDKAKCMLMQNIVENGAMRVLQCH